MKLLIISAITLFAFNMAICQESSIPAAIEDSFKSSYANATNIDWDKEGDLYEVEFDMNDSEYEIFYDESGNVVKENSEITDAELPELVRNTLNTEFPDREIDEIEKETRDGQVVYEVELKDFIFDDKVRISEEGQVVK